MDKLTNVAEFVSFHNLLMQAAPKDYTPFYFRCVSNNKEPYTKVGSWLKNPLTFEEACDWLRKGYNVGVAGLDEDLLVIIDIDDENITDYKTLKKTLTARSASRKGVHLFYFEDIPGLIPNIPTDDAGEIRANNQYVIAPGSYSVGYPDKVENIGKYTIEVATPAAKITLNEVPGIFKAQLIKNKEDENKISLRKEKREGKKTEGKRSALFDLTVYDVVSYAPNPQERFASIFHDSKTGKNTSINNGLIHCFRHMVTLNALQTLCVLSGYLTCQEAGSGKRGSNAGPSLVIGDERAIWEAWKYAKQQGLIPQNDPIPPRALAYVAYSGGFCKKDEIEDEWKIPIDAYGKTLSHLKEKKIDSGREFVETPPKKEDEKSEIQLHDAHYYLNVKERRDGTEEVVGIKHKLFADDLIAIHFLKTLRDTEEVIYYEEGYYHYEGEAIIRAVSEKIFGEHLNSYRVNEILNHIRRSTYIKREELNNDLWTLNLENGLFNIETFEFCPHTPNLLTTIRIPLTYDSTATCPEIDKFISEIVYPEHVKLIKEMIGYCLFHDYTYQNWFLLHGDGENGKSKLLSLIGKFLGEENISSIGLQDLNQRFAPVNLYGKSANVVADMSDADLKRTARLKQLTGGDLITAEPKFKNAFTYFNFAKLIYSCNKVPLTEDKSRAFFRRVIFIPFPNRFVVGENADENILKKLTTEKELSGLFNIAVESLKNITGNGGFSGYLTAEENEELYERASNPVYGFFHDCCEIDVEKYVIKMEFYDGFCEYCKEKKIVAFSEKKFTQEMKLLTRMEDEQKTVEKGYRKRVWKGISIKIAQDTHHTHDFPILKGSVEKIDDVDKIGKGCLGRENSVYPVHGVQDNEYATCERCGDKGNLVEYEELFVCTNCLRELLEEKREGREVI